MKGERGVKGVERGKGSREVREEVSETEGGREGEREGGTKWERSGGKEERRERRKEKREEDEG